MTPANEAARRNRQAQPVSANQTLMVYDGQHCAGSVLQRNGEFIAFDVHDRRVGVFMKQRDAVRELPVVRSSVDIERSYAARRDFETT